MNKFFIYLFILVILSNCNFVKKNDLLEEEIDTKNIFKKIEPIQKELNPNLKIQLTKFTKGNPFLRNNTNNNGNINFEASFQKIISYKFSNIDDFDFNQPELIFTDDKGVVFFDGKGSIFKINKNLKEIWKVNYYSKKERKLNPILYFAQNGKSLFVVDTLSKVYSLNLTNGDLSWSKDSISPFNSNIKIFKDRFMTLDFDNVLRCFSVNDGKELWKFKTEDSFIKSQKKLSLVLKGEVIYFINNLGDLTALNVNSGQLLWQTPTQSNTIYENAFSLENSDLIFANNSIYFSNNKNEIFSIDARTGIIKWKQNVNSSLRPTVVEKLIFSVSKEGFVFVMDDETGSIIRITNALKNIKNKKNEIEPTGFIIARNKIYLSLNNGRLLKIDIASGIQENVYKIYGTKISRPYIFNEKMFLIKKNAVIRIN